MKVHSYESCVHICYLMGGKISYANVGDKCANNHEGH